MKKLIALLILGISMNAFAFNDDPFEVFNASKKMTSKTTIKWEVVDNPSATCEAESKRRGYKGFGRKVFACSFWSAGITGDSCTIYTGKRTDMHQLGHETRHCFQGAFH